VTHRHVRCDLLLKHRDHPDSLFSVSAGAPGLSTRGLPFAAEKTLGWLELSYQNPIR